MEYEEVINAVKNGGCLRVDFKAQTAKLDGNALDVKHIAEGIEKITDLDEWLDKVEDLFDDYKYSRPSESSEKKARRAKFKALTADELIAEFGHDGLTNELERNEAQAVLELFILLSLVNGSFKPSQLFAKDWFYQGSDKSFILRKDWF